MHAGSSELYENVVQLHSSYNLINFSFHVKKPRTRLFIFYSARNSFLSSSCSISFLAIWDTGHAYDPVMQHVPLVIVELIVAWVAKKRDAGEVERIQIRQSQAVSQESPEEFESMARRALEMNSLHKPFPGSRHVKQRNGCASRILIATLRLSSINFSVHNRPCKPSLENEFLWKDVYNHKKNL